MTVNFKKKNLRKLHMMTTSGPELLLPPKLLFSIGGSEQVTSGACCSYDQIVRSMLQTKCFEFVAQRMMAESGTGSSPTIKSPSYQLKSQSILSCSISDSGSSSSRNCINSIHLYYYHHYKFLITSLNWGLNSTQHLWYDLTVSAVISFSCSQ